MKKKNRSVSDGKNERGRFTIIRRFPDLMAWVLATAPADRPGYCEVKWMVGGNGGASVVRASRWRDLECGLTNAGGGTGKMGGILNGLSQYYNSPGRLAVFRQEWFIVIYMDVFYCTVLY